MARKLALAMACIAVTAFALVPVAGANTLTASLDAGAGGITGGPGAYVWHYQVQEDTGGLVQTGATPIAVTPHSSAGSLYADYFTIYDFAGFTGAVTTPANWTFLSPTLNTGATDDSVIRTDNPGVVNLVWYYTGSSPQAGAFTTTGFSATSLYGGVNPNGQWSSEDTNTSTFTTSAAIGDIPVPVPVPAALGLGLLGFGMLPLIRRRKVHAAA